MIAGALIAGCDRWRGALAWAMIVILIGARYETSDNVPALPAVRRVIPFGVVRESEWVIRNSKREDGGAEELRWFGGVITEFRRFAPLSWRPEPLGYT